MNKHLKQVREQVRPTKRAPRRRKSKSKSPETGAFPEVCRDTKRALAGAE